MTYLITPKRTLRYEEKIDLFPTLNNISLISLFGHLLKKKKKIFTIFKKTLLKLNL